MAFRPAPMRKVNIFIPEGSVIPTTVALARLEAIDLEDSRGTQAWETRAGDRWEPLRERYRRLADRVETLLDTLEVDREPEAPPAEVDPEADIDELTSRLQEARGPIWAWKEQRDRLDEEINRLSLLVHEMELMAPLDINVDDLRRQSYLHLTVGTLPRDAYDSLSAVLFRIPYVIVPIHEEEKEEQLLIMAATDKDHAPILDRALRSLFFGELLLPRDLQGSPQEAAETLRQSLDKRRQKREELQQEQEQLAERWGDALIRLWRQARASTRVLDTVQELPRHGAVYLLDGWVAADRVGDVIDAVEEASDGRADAQVMEPIAESERQPPSLLRNPRWLKPFEPLVTTYGQPNYGELDPTPLVALTYILMFGVMFGDIGHGFLLALLGLWLARRDGAGSSLGVPIVAAGVSAMVFGVLYGSVFGREDILQPLWINPLQSISDILIASIIAGVVLLNIGFLLNLIRAARAGAWGEFLFGENGIAGIALYWILIGGAVALWQNIQFSLQLYALLVLVPVVLIFLEDPLGRLISGERPLVEGGWGEYSVQSFFELFEALISYISNSFSFVRLGAFAVAHAGLSQVVFILADVPGNQILGWIIIIVGTIIIVGFEGLIVAIQALRLEYYEFFGKFFNGRGRAFAPFRLLS